MLQREWEDGNIGDDVQKSILEGVIPIKLLREKLRWIIEREGNGLRLTVADALKIPFDNNYSHKKPIDNDLQDGFDMAA